MTCPTNTVLSYDHMEQVALQSLPSRVIEAAQCEAFAKVGYPSRIMHSKELWRYSNCMQENRVKLTWDLLGGLTQDEYLGIRHATADCMNLTRDMGHEVVPASALLRAVLCYRQVMAIMPKEAPFLTTLEIGPGSGYVTHLLDSEASHISANCCYQMDTSQAFTLWQQEFTPNNRQVYWWHWFKGQPDCRLDAMIASHCLNEMHVNALRFLVRRGEELLADHGALFAEGLGSDVIRQSNDTLKEFRGWKHYNRGNTWILVPPHSKVNMDVPQEAFTHGWHDLVQLWGGEPPMTEDEKFLAYCERR